MVSSFAAPGARRAASRVPVAVVERHEDAALRIPLTRAGADRAARRATSHEVAFPDAEPLRILARELDPDLRRGRLELGARAVFVRVWKW